MFRRHSCISTVPRLVQALVITHDGIFHALTTDPLLPKQFLDLGIDGVVRWKALGLSSGV
jgi:hypothetical protein